MSVHFTVQKQSIYELCIDYKYICVCVFSYKYNIIFKSAYTPRKNCCTIFIYKSVYTYYIQECIHTHAQNVTILSLFLV